MGRKKKEQTGPRDRIGEPLDLEKCPLCEEHPDCFSNISGHCSALRESGGAECVFYKPEAAAVMENKRIYRKLRENGRGDLISAHEKVLAALGVFDEEINAADDFTEDLEAFGRRDYENALAEEALEAGKEAGKEGSDGIREQDADDIGEPPME